MVPTYVESGGEEDEDEEISDEYAEENVSSMVVKSEVIEYGARTPNNYGAATPNFAASEHAGNGFAHHSFSSGFSNGHANGHSNGNHNGLVGSYDMEGEDEFHEARHNQFENGYDDDAV